jgi:excisionase family DNA binding protein
MEDEWLSVGDVAGRLGLHVRTVRGYVRDGRLKAVRIGKQYRIAQADLDAFTGRPAAASRAAVEVSAVIEMDGMGAVAADRLSTLLVAGAQLNSGPDQAPLRVRTVYDDVRGRFKVIVLGGLAPTADLLQMINDIVGSENGMLPDQEDHRD